MLEGVSEADAFMAAYQVATAGIAGLRQEAQALLAAFPASQKPADLPTDTPLDLERLSEGVLAALTARGVEQAHVTLHVGAGTFQPVRVEKIDEHKMHSEWFEVPQATVEAIAACRARGGRVVAVGTTTLRALESAARGGALQAGARETDIFITPGFEFRVVDRLVTNFHLPESTLLMLVSALAGRDRILQAYRHAVDQRYRFFSYGDSMLLTPGKEA